VPRQIPILIPIRLISCIFSFLTKKNQEKNSYKSRNFMHFYYPMRIFYFFQNTIISSYNQECQDDLVSVSPNLEDVEFLKDAFSFDP